MKGNERISARVQEIVGRAAERAEVSLERILRELAAIAFSNISKAVTWGPSVQVREEEEDGQRVKIDASGRGRGTGNCEGIIPISEARPRLMMYPISRTRMDWP